MVLWRLQLPADKVAQGRIVRGRILRPDVRFPGQRQVDNQRIDLVVRGPMESADRCYSSHADWHFEVWLRKCVLQKREKRNRRSADGTAGWNGAADMQAESDRFISLEKSELEI